MNEAKGMAWWTALLQLSILSGYSSKQVTRAAHLVVSRALPTSCNDHTQTVKYLYTILPHPPMLHCCHLSFCTAWLAKRPHWAGPSCSSWFHAPSVSPNGTTGFWCADWHTLATQATAVRPNNHICPTGSLCVCVCVCVSRWLHLAPVPDIPG